ncbi:TRAP transporter substrate-binding protein [Sporosarcina siberiensis]|uniref:TRAP transporter substrate-binding protein n=1 Tax=Sporosarcina siberiensis TaxID=1365606 RepID=A0ABW4SI34_9BACL
MRKKYFRATLLSVLILSLLVIAGCGDTAKSGDNDGNNENAERTLKITHIGSDDHVLNLTSKKFKEEVEKNTNGRIKVEIYPRMQLGGEADMMEQMKNGSLDMAQITVATLSSRSESFNAWLMPYAVDGLEVAYEMTNSEIGKDILNSLPEGEGVVPLGYSMIPPRHISSPQEITKMSDFKGMKIRISPAQAIGDFYKALGAVPTAMEQQEIYNALQTGVIDGMDSDLESVIVNRFFEISENLNLTRHHHWTMGVLFSEKIWSELSDGDQEIVQEAVDAASTFSYEYTLESENKFKGELEEKGVKIVEFQEMDEIRKVAEQVHEKYSSNPLIAEFIKIAKDNAGE